ALVELEGLVVVLVEFGLAAIFEGAPALGGGPQRRNNAAACKPNGARQRQAGAHRWDRPPGLSGLPGRQRGAARAMPVGSDVYARMRHFSPHFHGTVHLG